MIAEPLTRLQCCVDLRRRRGRRRRTAARTRRDVAVRACAIRSGGLWDHRSEHVWGFGIVEATARAAASSRPAVETAEVDLFEVHDAFTIGEIVTTEALGLAGRATGAGWRPRRTAIGGGTPSTRPAACCRAVTRSGRPGSPRSRKSSGSSAARPGKAGRGRADRRRGDDGRRRLRHGRQRVRGRVLEAAAWTSATMLERHALARPGAPAISARRDAPDLRRAGRARRAARRASVNARARAGRPGRRSSSGTASALLETLLAAFHGGYLRRPGQRARDAARGGAGARRRGGRSGRLRRRLRRRVAALPR